MRTFLVLVTILASAMTYPVCAADPAVAQDSASPGDDVENTQYELMFITAKPGKLEQVHVWLRDHHDDVLAKHGATNLAFLVPVGENPENQIVCLLRYRNLLSFVRFGRGLLADPLWAALDPEQGSPDLLVTKTESITLQTTDYSPEFSPTKASEPRVFELRTYLSPSRTNLAYLDDRFRAHTMKLFEKHGMENLIYWHPVVMEHADRRLVYLLGHKSVEAAKESFANFRKDPDWLAAREASERKAGGSLTEKEGGVVSEFFVATDYSPLQ